MAGGQSKRRGRAKLGATVVLAGFAISLSGAAEAREATFRTYAKKAAFDDVRFELQNAIIKRGLTIDFNGQVGKMLERTGADIGSTKPIYRQAEYFSFCSAKLSRRALEADVRNIGHCPYVVFIYETAAVPGTVHVGYRRPQPRGSKASRGALGEVEKLLDGIAKESVQ